MTRILRSSPLTALGSAATVLALMTLAGCGGSDAEPDATRSTPASSPTDTPTSDTTSDPTTDAPTDSTTDQTGSPTSAAAAGKTPAWAKPATTPGTSLGSFKVGDIAIDVYQVGTAPASKQGMFADPKTSKPLIAKGTPIVVLNYVVTNKGASSVNLSNLLVAIEATYDDWQFIQGMDGVTDYDLFQRLNVHRDTSDALDLSKASAQGPYPFEPGQTFSYGTDFKYEKGEGITFKAEVVPADASGAMLHDQTKSAEAHFKIK